MSTKTSRSVLPLFVLLGGILMFLMALGPRSAAAQSDTWRARYYNNRTLAGDPRVVRDESAVDHDWGGGAPVLGVSDDNFSVRWTRDVSLSGGTYRFTATMDDGMRVWVDDQLIIDSWTDSQQHTIQAIRTLSAGTHSFRVEYYEAGGQAIARLTWDQIGGPPGGIVNWRGEYFANRTLSGSPLVTRDDANVNFDWGNGGPAPGMAGDNFSVRWSRTLNFNPGNYRFEVFSDDGVRLWVNNLLVIDQWRDQSDGRFAANVSLPGGPVALRLEYYEAGGRAAVSLSWSPPGGSPLPPTGGNNGPWRGEYFGNTGLVGNPAAVRTDANLDFNWGNGAPIGGVGFDQFSVRWTRLVNFPAGTYRFDVFADDGVRLWVNNQLLIDAWREQSDGRYSASIALPGGSTPVRLEYFESLGRAAVSLSWNPPVTGGPTPPPITGPTATVSNTGGARLNVRQTPGGLILSQLQANQTVGLTGFRNADSSWVEIFRPEGGVGWVSSRYVTLSVPLTSLVVK